MIATKNEDTVTLQILIAAGVALDTANKARPMKHHHAR
jgi:hypothetical protein